jgi:serpin B
MDIVLPAQGRTLDSFVGSLTAQSWDAMVSQLHSTKVDLALPKLTLAYERMLNDDLKALGMVDAFAPGGADFTRMSPAGRDLYIAFVKHKAWVEINEEGSEAAAATAVGVSVTSAPIIPIMRVDRPYLFVIRERLSGTILFVGKIQNIP